MAAEGKDVNVADVVLYHAAQHRGQGNIGPGHIKIQGFPIPEDLQGYLGAVVPADRLGGTRKTELTDVGASTERISSPP